MKFEDFQRLLVRSTENTSHVRGFDEHWLTGVQDIPDDISYKIDCIVMFLQDKINSGLFCNKDEYLMIYNFQPLHDSVGENEIESAYLCSLDMVVRPMSKIGDLKTCEGKPLQLVIDAKDGIIANNSYALKKMGIFDEGVDEAVEVYGNYFNYLEPKTPMTPTFSERLKALETHDKTKIKTKLEHPRIDVLGHDASMQKAITFAFAGSSLCDPLSPTSTVSHSQFTKAINPSSDSGFKKTSALECGA